MSEEKEGKTISHQGKATLGGDSVVVIGIDKDISNIEEQLKKAQDTLDELQSLKVKLEEDRLKKQQEEKKQQELLDAVKVNEENTKLKTEMKNYQGEVNSLKDIIASLKDDLIKSTDQLQQKVTNSLKILEEAEAGLKSQNLNITVSTSPKTEEPTPAPTPSPEPQAAPEPVHVASEPAPAESPIIPVVTTETAASLKTASAEEIAQAQEDAESISIEQELDEYKKIKEELSALEDGDTPLEKSEVNNVITSTPIKEAMDEEHIPIPSDNPPQKTADGNIPIPVKVNITPATPVKSVEEAEPIETPETPTKTEEKKEEKKKKGFLFFKKKNKPAAIHQIKPEPKKEESEEEKPSKKGKLIHLFKRKHKIKKEAEASHSNKDDGRPANPKADSASGGLLMKTAVLLLILFIGGIGYQIKNADKVRKVYIDQVKGEVKGASTSKTIVGQDGTEINNTSPEDRYKEAFTDEPFENSNWVTYENPELGFKIEYSKNTSNLYQPLDSTSTWFLRKNGYLVKIDKITTEQTLEEYQASQKSGIDYKVENATFAGQPALLLTLNEYMEVQGNYYLVKNGSDLYKIWYKTFAPGEEVDDEQRVQRMIGSFNFTDPKPITKAKKTKN